MDKTANAYRTISEAAAELNLPQHVLRFWETRFPQIKPLKRGGGRRYYRPDDIELLRAIQTLLYSDGYTIKGVQRILREQNIRQLINASRDAREQGLPLILFGSEPGAGTGQDETACHAAQDEHLTEEMSMELGPSPQTASISPEPNASIKGLPAGLSEIFEALLLELTECREILDKLR